MSWTTIPRWLYENDLPDERLQELYVTAAHVKWVELLEERRELDEPDAELDAQIAQAKAFFIEAAENLARYRKRLGRGA